MCVQSSRASHGFCDDGSPRCFHACVAVIRLLVEYHRNSGVCEGTNLTAAQTFCSSSCFYAFLPTVAPSDSTCSKHVYEKHALNVLRRGDTDVGLRSVTSEVKWRSVSVADDQLFILNTRLLLSNRCVQVQTVLQCSECLFLDADPAQNED